MNEKEIRKVLKDYRKCRKSLSHKKNNPIEERRLKQKMEYARTLISLIDTSDAKWVVHERYIKGTSAKQFAMRNYYSERWFYLMVEKGINEIRDKLNEVTHD